MNSFTAISIMLLQIALLLGFIAVAMVVTCKLCRDAFHALIVWTRQKRGAV